MDALLELVRTDDSVLDVGGGAGRIALPLAKECRKVVVVEPSKGMRTRLLEQIDAWGLRNVTVIDGRWEDVNAPVADVVICAHVVYTVRAIGAFIRKLRSRARRLVAIVVFEEPAMANYCSLWPLVHDEERLSLPAFTELQEVLREISVEFETRQLNEWGPRGFSDRESTMQECMARLFIAPGTEAEAKLMAALDDVLVNRDGRLHFKWSSTHRPWIVSLPPS